MRVITRDEDVQWNRPIFKAPPLAITPPPFAATIFAHGIRRDLIGEK
jgi:hypothetical protein